MNKTMEIMDITLRDAQQCLWATRMPTSEMLPIARTMDEAGFAVIDLVGGAAIDLSVMYLAEDPFERIREMARLITKTPLNFNTRGQSVFRWMQYADDVTDFALKVLRRNGIRSIMVFDALNDIRNLRASVRAAKALDMFIIGAVVYAISPVHTDEHFVEKAIELVDLGVDALEIKDPSGLLTPERTRKLVPAVRAAIGGRAQLQLHSHCSYGHGLDTYRAAIDLAENGVDLLHCASTPLAYGWSLPPHALVIEDLKKAGYSVRVDEAAIREMDSYFGMIARRGKRPPGKILPERPTDDEYQIPGGMMSNMVRQLSDQGQGHRLQEVLDEIARIRRELGWPIMVSPMSQYIATQGVMNVLTGKRYQVVPQEVKQYVLGYYGKVPGKIDPEARAAVAGDEPGIEVAPGELIPPMMDAYRREFGPCSDEELFLRIFYSPQTLAENARARLSIRHPAPATDAASFIARELLGKADIEICEVDKGDFHFSLNRQAASTNA